MPRIIAEARSEITTTRVFSEADARRIVADVLEAVARAMAPGERSATTDEFAALVPERVVALSEVRRLCALAWCARGAGDDDVPDETWQELFERGLIAQEPGYPGGEPEGYTTKAGQDYLREALR